MEFLNRYGDAYFLVLIIGVVSYLVGNHYCNSRQPIRGRTFMVVARACAALYVLGSLVLILVTDNSHQMTGLSNHVFGVLVGGVNCYFAHKAIQQIDNR